MAYPDGFQWVLRPAIAVGDTVSALSLGRRDGRIVETTEVAYGHGDVRLVVAHLSRQARERNGRSLNEVQVRRQRVTGEYEWFRVQGFAPSPDDPDSLEAVYGADSRGTEYATPWISYDGLLAGLAIADGVYAFDQS